MRNNRYQDFLEDEILAANPLRLVQLLYQGALDSIISARRHLKFADIRARSRAISKAMSIVTELSLSLDHATGGELSKNLADLYAYTQKLLIQANTQQTDAPLAEAERLLSTLLEAWQRAHVPHNQANGSEVAEGRSNSYQPVSCAY